MKNKFPIIMTTVVVLFIGIIVLTIQSEKDKSKNALSNAKISNNVYGKKDSPVTLTEYVDFQCEACYEYYPYVKEIKEKYKDRVKFQIKYFPIEAAHPFAVQAAISAEAAARQGKFFEMHDLIFEGQKTWERTTDPGDMFEQYAQSIGLDMDKYKSDIASEEVEATVRKDLKEVTDLGGQGTPTFVLNENLIDSPEPTIEAFSKLLDEELSKAGL